MRSASDAAAQGYPPDDAAKRMTVDPAFEVDVVAAEPMIRQPDRGGAPSVLYPTDPEFRTIELICDLVGRAKDRAAIVDLAAIAGEVARA